MKKIAVFHDHFMYRGGGERLITLLAKALNADLISGFFDEGSLDPREVGFSGNIIEITKPGFTFFDKRSYQVEKQKDRSFLKGTSFILMKGLRHLALKIAILFQTKILREYDIVIFSGDGIGAVKNCKKDAKKIYYCHTPPRYLYDQKEVYLTKVPLILKPAYLLACYFFEKLYRRDFAKMDIILTNSKNVQARIKHFLGRDSQIVYPPVDISFFKPLETKSDYYFSWARLTQIKRVDRIVEAFIQMPDKKLIISHGSNDPEKLNIAKMIAGHDNIKMVESPNDTELRRLISESIATIFIPVDEDFGMTPVESMACGVPVIGVNDGGVKEIVINGETGILISSEARIEDIKKAVIEMDLAKSLSLKDNCIKRAKVFSLETFEEKIKNVVN
ncbi:MAG: glycosyltransferase [Candidatus Gracilibacteria bacterium]|nr:glycosyltransferase [Candidatus Gracilibacteria bacterium]MDD2908829.1 glycosyltransferase [Candidatus Gracilibacteria bacterium]